MTETFSAAKPSETGRKTPIWQSDWFNTLGRFLALVLVFLFFAVVVKEGKFCTLRNLENILLQSAVYATAALGMTMIIITAGIDLSIGSMIALTVVVVASVLNLHYEGAPAADGKEEVVFLIQQWPVALPILAVLAAVGAATLAGMLNGISIVGLRLVPFIVTLGTMMIFRAAAKGIAHEKDIYPPETWVADILDPTLIPWVKWITGESAKRPEGLGWLILPLGVWILLISAVAAALLLRYTRLGRHIFAIGSNAGLVSTFTGDSHQWNAIKARPGEAFSVIWAAVSIFPRSEAMVTRSPSTMPSFSAS